MPAPRNNKNAAGKRVDRERITVSLGISHSNGLLELFSRYLSEQGINPSDENIKQIAANWAYQAWADWLKREVSESGATIA